MTQSQVQLPSWVLFIRIGQAVFNVIVLGLTAYAASVFGVFSGYALDFFTFIWTMAFIGFALVLRPRLKTVNPIIGVIPEIATAFWWLVTFALLASEASIINGWQELANLYIEEASDDLYGYTIGKRGNAALGCTKGAAVVGAFLFVSFLATTGIYVATMLRQKNTGNPNMMNGGEPKQTGNYPGPQPQSEYRSPPEIYQSA